MWNQIWRKGVGLIVYILLGGSVASLVAGWVTIEGASGTLPKILVGLIVGASWTTYLSVIWNEIDFEEE